MQLFDDFGNENEDDLLQQVETFEQAVVWGTDWTTETITNQLLKGISKIRHIPCTIIHGRYDLVCPIFSALKLKKTWKKAKLVITLAGHASSEPANAKALKRAVKSFA